MSVRYVRISCSGPAMAFVVQSLRDLMYSESTAVTNCKISAFSTPFTSRKSRRFSVCASFSVVVIAAVVVGGMNSGPG